MNLKIRQKLFLWMALVVLADILAVAGWRFVRQEIADERDNILYVRSELDDVRTKVANIKNLEDLLKNIVGDTERIDASFIDERGLVAFIKELERVADLSGVRLEVSRATAPRAGKERGPDFGLSVNGTFDGVYRFMSLLNHVPYQVLFENVTLQKAPKASKDTGPWEAYMDLRVLSYIFD